MKVQKYVGWKPQIIKKKGLIVGMMSARVIRFTPFSQKQFQRNIWCGDGVRDELTGLGRLSDHECIQRCDNGV